MQYAHVFHADSDGGWRAGRWRGLEVAIKTVVFESGDRDSQTALVASEAAIASNLVHSNIVATYWHDVRTVSDAHGLEFGIFKLCLVQVRLRGPSRRLVVTRPLRKKLVRACTNPAASAPGGVRAVCSISPWLLNRSSRCAATCEL